MCTGRNKSPMYVSFSFSLLLQLLTSRHVTWNGMKMPGGSRRRCVLNSRYLQYTSFSFILFYLIIYAYRIAITDCYYFFFVVYVFFFITCTIIPYGPYMQESCTCGYGYWVQRVNMGGILKFSFTYHFFPHNQNSDMPCIAAAH